MHTDEWAGKEEAVNHTERTSRTILVILLGLATLIGDQAFAQTPGGRTASQGAAAPHCAGWNLATELRVSPEQANPNPDHCGNADVWHFMESSTLVHDPATYSPLPEFITDAFSITGLQQWQDAFHCSTSCKDKLPTVGINATGVDQPVVGSWPAGAVRLHPMPTQLAIVGWRSPINGSISVSGAFASMGGHCGNGVAWFIDRGTTTLANGSFPNGGAQDFQLADISVSQGDFLYFIVDPNGDHTCDSTRLEVTLTPVEPTTYRLTRIGDEVFNLSGIRPTIHDINENGDMVGSAPLVPGGPDRAILLRNDTVTDLGDLTGASPNAFAWAINDLTQVAGTNKVEGGSGIPLARGFLWNGGQIRDLDVEGIPFDSPLDINNRGQIVGVSISPENIERPFLWQAGTMKILETETAACPGNLGGSARAINGNGVVVGFVNSRAVLWEAGGGAIKPLEPPLALQTGEAVDVNDRGQVIGLYFDLDGGPLTATALLWQGDQVTVLPPLDPQATGAFAASINNLGQIVGHTNVGTRQTATLWRGSAVLDLNTLISDDEPEKGFVSLKFATKITDSGLIVALGEDPRVQSNESYYLLTPTGTPAEARSVLPPASSSAAPGKEGKGGGGAVDPLSLLLLLIVVAASAVYPRGGR